MKHLNPIFFPSKSCVLHKRKSSIRSFTPVTLFKSPTSIFRQDLIRRFFLLSFALIGSLYDVAAQAPGSPCYAHRWEQGGAWTGTGCSVDDGNNAPDPLGVVRCGNSADTEAGVDENTTYDPGVFTIVPSMCEDPNTTLPITVSAPFTGQRISWFNFDVRPYAGVYDFQTIATGNYELEWALYYSLGETCGTGTNDLSGDCAVLSGVIACGTDFNGWSPQPYLTPIFDLSTNLYLAVWKKGATDSSNDDFVFTFKARYGCGDFCSLQFDAAPVVTCNPDGSYQVVQQLNGTNSTVTVSAPGSTSTVTVPSPLIFTTADAIPNINTGTVTVTYPAGVNYDITYTPSGDGPFCLPLTRSGTAPNCCTVPVCSIDGPDNVCPAATAVYCGPVGESGYSWTVSGSVTIIGATNAQCVTVSAANACDATYAVSLTVGIGTCTSFCTEIVTINDTIPPIVICPEVVSPIYCPALPVFPDAIATDACDASVAITFVDIAEPGQWPEAYTEIRTWTATDDCGNTATCSATITILDNTAPVLTCPTVISPIECGSVASFGIATAIDACDPDVDVTFSDITVQGACSQSYSITRTWTAVDNSLNSSTCSRTIVVQDNTSPVIICPDVVSPIACGTIPFFGEATVSDACDTSVILVFSDVTIEGLCDETNSVTRTWVATDDCGNTATCSATIIVEANQNLEVFDCPSDTLVGCENQVPPIDISLVEVSGNCGTITVTHLSDVISDQTCLNTYTLTRTYQGIDTCGQVTTCSQIINVRDVMAPVLTCPAVISPVECGANLSFGVATATDACDAAVEVSFSDVTFAGTCAQEYSVTRTWIATDDCGNSASCSRTIVVQDNTAPVILCPVVVSPIPCGSIPSFGTPTVTDVCDTSLVVSFTDLTIAGLCPQEYTVTRTWVATDDCGNIASCSATIVVGNAATQLAILCPADITIQCEEEVPGIDISLVSYSGNCGTVTVTHLNDVITNQTCVTNYTLVRTYQATDACGDVVTCSQIILVSDTTSPVITFQLPLSQQSGDTLLTQCYGQDPEWDLPSYGPENIIVSGVCAGNYTITYDISLGHEGNCEADGYINLYRLEWTVSDSCGNSSSAHLFLALVDSIPPVIEGVPADITVTCENIPVPPSLFATDECLCACVVYMEETETDPTSCQDGQVIIRTWTARDRCGNETIDTQRITLIDEVGPIVHIIHPELVEFTNDSVYVYSCTEGGIPAFFDLMDANAVSAIGVCDSNTTVTFKELNSIQTNCEYFGYLEQRSYQWTATDPCGNATVLSITVRLTDDEAPVFPNLPEMICIGDPILNDIEVSDNCDHVSVRFWDVDISNPCGLGTAQRRTYEASDRCGNVAIDTVIILPLTQNLPNMVFVDQELQLLDSNLVMTLNCESIGGQYTAFTIDDVSVDGFCAAGVTIEFAETVISTNDCVPGEPLVTVELKWTATDVCGSFTERIIIAEIIDETGPEFVNFKPELSIGCDDIAPQSVATDNCGDVSITYLDTILQGACAFEYDLVRVITATDICGNATTRRQTVHVGNVEGPVITGVELQVCDDLSIPEVAAYDDCANQFVNVTMVQDTLDSECRGGLVIQRTWSARDACGNASEVVQTIVMNDFIAPELLVPSYSVINHFMEQENNTVYHSEIGLLAKLNAIDGDEVSATDECDKLIIPFFTLDTLFGEDCIEHRTYTWIATDICGSADTLSFDVDIIDDVTPDFMEVIYDTLIFCGPLPVPTSMLLVDSLENVTIVYTEIQEAGPVSGQIIVTRTWTATDSCQNSTTYVQEIIWNQESAMQCAIILPEVVDCNSHGVLITSEIRGGVGPFTYQWEVVGEKCFIQSGQNTPEILIYVGWADVTIILTVTDSFGCVTVCEVSLECNDVNALSAPDSSEDIYMETVEGQALFLDPMVNSNVEQNGDVENFSFYPNPADEVIHLAFESQTEGIVDIRVTDYLGKVIKKESMMVHKGHNVQQMDASGLVNGSYLIQIQSGKAQFVRGVIILHLD